MTDWDMLPVDADDLGESPLWDADGAVLWWVDVSGRRARRLHVASGETQQWEMPADVPCLALTTGRQLLVCLAASIERLDPETGRLERLVGDPEPDLQTRFNDGRCDARGRFWCGTMALAGEEPLGGLYRLDPDGSLSRVVSGVVLSNGIDWSPDEQVVYHTDTARRTITAYDHDPAAGTIDRPRAFVRDDDGYPDGLVVDAEGGVWSAKWDGWRVVRYLPDGTIDRVLRLPVQRPTSCAIGGPDRRTLYVTTARYGLDHAALREQPLAGRILVLDAGVAGLPARRFAG